MAVYIGEEKVDLYSGQPVIEASGTIQITENGLHDIKDYAEANVNVVPDPPTETLNIEENGTYDVTNYATAEVDVSSFTPTGTLTIMSNGTYDVTDYASAEVDVPSFTPTGTLTIMSNGTYDVTNYASANILVISKYITFTAETPNSTIQLVRNARDLWNIVYSTDNINWQPYTFGTVLTMRYVGDYVSFAGYDNLSARLGDSDRYTFRGTGYINCSGNCCGLLSQGPDVVSEGCFNRLFEDFTTLLTAPILPVTTFAEGCCNSMFSGCESLTIAPAIYATTLAPWCCAYMFSGCTDLETVSELPATILADHCYMGMYSGCSRLTAAQRELPAQVVPEGAYAGMYEFCGMLLSAPRIKGTVFNEESCEGMFTFCSSLNHIKIDYQGDISSNDAFAYWVDEVSSTGDFYYNGTDTTRGASAIPEGWTVHTF